MVRIGARTRFVRLLVACSLLGLLLPLAAPLSVGAANAPAASQTIDGLFTTIDGDPDPRKGGAAREVYFVTDAKGVTTQLILSEQLAKAAGGIMAIDRKPVTVTVDGASAAPGTPAPARTVSAIALSGGKKASTPRDPTFGTQAFINIMCKYSDDASEPVTSAYIQNQLFSATAPGLNAYWIENSFGNINLNGTQTVGWFTLPSPRATYLNPDGSANLTLLAQDCTGRATTVNFNNFIGFNLIFNGLLDCCAWGGGVVLNLSGTNKAWAATWMPPWGYFPNGDPVNLGQTILAHETGHAFGLRHSGDKIGTTYASGWDPMSGAQWRCDLLNDPAVGCRGRDGIAFDKDFLGWIPLANKQTITGANQTFTLTNLAGGPVGTNPLEIIVPDATNPGTQWTTVEMRNQFGNDAKNPAVAVIIQSVDTTRTNPAWIMASNPACTTGAGGSCGTDDAKFLAGSQYAVPNSGGVVVKVNSVGPNSALVTVGNGGGPPPTPTGLAATAATYNSVTWTWANPDPTASVTVFDGTTATPLAPGTTTFTKFGIAYGSFGCLTIAAWNGSGTSAWSTWVCSLVRPLTPFNPHATGATNSTVNFGWANYDALSLIAAFDGTTNRPLGQNATTYTATGVPPGMFSCQSIASYNAQFTSAYSPWACGFAVPVIPTGVAKSNSTTTSVSFSWVNSDPFSLIQAYVGVNGGAPAWQYVGANATTLTVMGVPTGGYACIQVNAFNSYNGTYAAGTLGYSGLTGWVCGATS